MAKRRTDWLRRAVHVAALIPLALLIYDSALGRLSVNPIQDLTLRTGKTALILLVLSLACTPVRMLFGWKAVLALRRPLGLYAFFYACLHLAVFAALDYGFDMGLIGQAVAEKRYIVAGFSSFLLLLLLAITSTRGAMRRLGKRWKPLHRLVYLAALLVGLHYVWLSKIPWGQPLFFLIAIVVLLLVRLPAVGKWEVRSEKCEHSR